MSRYYESDFVGGILPLRMTLMKIPIKGVRRGISVSFDGGVTFNFFEGDSIGMFNCCCFSHVSSAHDKAAKSFDLGFQEVMV